MGKPKCISTSERTQIADVSCFGSSLGRAADVWRFGQYHLLWISRTMSSVQMCSVSSSLIYSIAKYCNIAHTSNIPERKPSQGQPSVQLFDVLILGNATMPEARDIMKET